MNRFHNLSRAALVISLMTVAAHLQIPFGAVPVTLQTMVCILAGRILGAKWGAYAMLGYILAGLVGLPVFAAGAGLGYVLQPTFGYLVGFVVAASYTGWMGKKADTFFGSILMVTTALFIIYSIGSIHLYLSFTVIQEISLNVWQVLYAGVFPYILQDYVSAFLGILVWSKIQGRIPRWVQDVR